MTLASDGKTCLAPSRSDIWSNLPTYAWVLIFILLILVVVGIVAVSVWFFKKKDGDGYQRN